MYAECNIVARLSNLYCHGNATVVNEHTSISLLTRDVESLATGMQQCVLMIVALRYVAVNVTHLGRRVKCPNFWSVFNQI
jgi:hypothetical protein